MFNPLFDNQNDLDLSTLRLPGIQSQNSSVDNLYRQIASGGYGAQTGSRMPRPNIDFGGGVSSGGRYDIPMPAKARIATPADASQYPMARLRTRISAPGTSYTGGFNLENPGGMNLGTPNGSGNNQINPETRRLSRRKFR